MPVNDTFQPAWWLKNPHLQTIWPTFSRRFQPKLKLKRERFELPDGDFVDLDWIGEDSSAPIVIVLHGLEGSVRSPYVQGIMQAIKQRGWRGVLMHFRSCSGEMNRYPKSYHSGATEDLAALVSHLEKCNPNVKIVAVGYSLGGNVLLKWLGETGNNNPLTAAVAVSVPFRLEVSAARIQQGFSRFYQWYFLYFLRRKIRRKFAQLAPPFSLPELKQLKTLRDFDERITAPLHGFLNAEDYYKQSSSLQFLQSIGVPTLLLHAQDDPLMTGSVWPKPDELSLHVTLELTQYGGHVGFVSGKLPWRPDYWLEKRIPDFLSLRL